MILAAADFIVWLIIAVVVMIAKGFGKLTQPGEEEGVDEDVPVPAPRPRPATPKPRPAAQVEPPPIREMMDRLVSQTRHIPVAAAPVVPPEPPAPAPVKATPAPVEKPRPARSQQWATALRDKSNVRNIIVAAEIIGPPKGDRL